MEPPLEPTFCVPLEAPFDMYKRLLRIMMLSVAMRASMPVKVPLPRERVILSIRDVLFSLSLTAVFGSLKLDEGDHRRIFSCSPSAKPIFVFALVFLCDHVPRLYTSTRIKCFGRTCRSSRIRIFKETPTDSHHSAHPGELLRAQHF